MVWIIKVVMTKKWGISVRFSASSRFPEFNRKKFWWIFPLIRNFNHSLWHPERQLGYAWTFIFPHNLIYFVPQICQWIFLLLLLFNIMWMSGVSGASECFPPLLRVQRFSIICAALPYYITISLTMFDFLPIILFNSSNFFRIIQDKEIKIYTLFQFVSNLEKKNWGTTNHGIHYKTNLKYSNLALDSTISSHNLVNLFAQK